MHYDENKPDARLRFSACAVIDLLGFSSHLEVSGYDLRTSIGEHAIMRLQNLEEGITRLTDERVRRPEYYPAGLHVKRINDAIILAIDLDDVLLPPVGETNFRGISAADFKKFFTDNELRSEQSYTQASLSRVRKAIQPLEQFLGVVCRLHLLITKGEKKGCFPGTRTVVATGFRKPFFSRSDEEDVLSANFAFANAYSAERTLHGPHLFVDNNIEELLSENTFSRNLLRLAHFHWQHAIFDCLLSDGGRESAQPTAELPKPIEINLFRQPYVFRRLNASAASYLQNVPQLDAFLSGAKEPARSNIFYAHVLDAMRYGMNKRMMETSNPPLSFVYGGTNDLDVDVAEFEEFITTGESRTQSARKKAERRCDLEPAALDENSELSKKLDALEDEVVQIDVDPIDIADFGPAVWSLREEDFSALRPFLAGDTSRLGFPVDPQ